MPKFVPLTVVSMTLAACATTGEQPERKEPTTPTEAAAPSAAAPATSQAPPSTHKVAVTDTYHGVRVTEHYRWLENWNDLAVKGWSEAQNAYARSILDELPGVEPIAKRVGEIFRAKSIRYFGLQHRRGKLFAEKYEPPKQQPFLVVMPSAEAADKQRVLVDPNVIDSTGKTSIDWYVASFDGKLVAVSLSKGGTETGDVHVFETATGKQVHEVVPRVNGGTAGGDLAWDPRGKGFYYSRYPREGERPKADMNFYVQVYYHRLGTSPEKDRYEIGKDFPRIAEIDLEMDRSGRLLATVQKGDGGEFSHYLRSKKGKWRQFSTYGDKTLMATFGPKRDLYVLTRKDAPKGKILRVKIKKLDVAKGRVVVPEGEDTVVDSFWGSPTVLPTKKKLYVLYQLGGPSEIRAFDLRGRPLPAPKQLPVSSADGMTPIGGDDILFRDESYVEPPAWYRFNAKKGETKKTALVTEAPVDLSKLEVRREFATSKDGTKVPVNILVPPGLAMDGSDPCVLYGYGGYGVNVVPRFSARSGIFSEQGVIYAVANLRGGGEYGEEWHRQGNLLNKQNVFDDFKAAIDHLVEKKYTNPQRLGILGGSNGGLLMGATMTQHPTAVKVVVSFVGIYDMLRVELSPNGAFNVTEFGTVKDPEQFKALHAYSPYHQVEDETPYPPTLMLTGANDPRVDPMQSRKMTARLQAANSSGSPILLRTSADTGHGGGTPLEERIAQYVDVFAFYFHHLGVEYKAP